MMHLFCLNPQRRVRRFAMGYLQHVLSCHHFAGAKPVAWVTVSMPGALIGAPMITLQYRSAFALARCAPQARIYRDVFEPVELKPVEFMQLMDLAQRRVVLQGNDINQQGRPHEEMFLIVEGTADVRGSTTSRSGPT